MVLKKQTVFLLTLLTLMVVLFAYQLTTEPTQQATTDTKQGDSSIDANGETDVTLNSTVYDFFTTTKLERDNKRQLLFEQLNSVVGDTTKPSEEIVRANDEMLAIQTMVTSESEIEDVLAASYEDAVVLTNNGSVEVIVKTSALTASQADEIIQLVRNEMNVDSASITVSAKAE